MATAVILNCRNFRTLLHINFSGDAKRNMETNKKRSEKQYASRLHLADLTS